MQEYKKKHFNFETFSNKQNIKKDGNPLGTQTRHSSCYACTQIYVKC